MLTYLLTNGPVCGATCVHDALLSGANLDFCPEPNVTELSSVRINTRRSSALDDSPDNNSGTLTAPCIDTIGTTHDACMVGFDARCGQPTSFICVVN